MHLKKITPILYTLNLSETISFYTRILGFTCHEFNEKWQWAALQKDDVEIMFSKPNELLIFQRSNFTGSFYFEIEDVKRFWQIVKQNVEVVYEPEYFEWGMFEFAIKDNNGYILQFGEMVK